MGKSAGTNQKSVEAKERKASALHEKTEKEKHAKEDALWVENDAKALKAQKREQERQEKLLQEEKKRMEKKLLLVQDESVANPKVKPKEEPKLTRYQIQLMAEADNSKNSNSNNSNNNNNNNNDGVVTPEDLLVDNVNHMQIEGEEARTVTDAINVLSSTKKGGSSSSLHGGGNEKEEDRNPERRMKAAHRVFEERTMAELKAEHPYLRHSQLKEMCWNLWLKSPENPINIAAVAAAASKNQQSNNNNNN